MTIEGPSQALSQDCQRGPDEPPLGACVPKIIGKTATTQATDRENQSPARGSEWAELPGPVVASILLRLRDSPGNIAVMRQTCTSWRLGVSCTVSQLTPVGPQPRPGAVAETFPSLLKLNWSRCISPMSDRDVASILPLKMLRSLSCGSVRVTSKDHSRITDDGLAALTVLPSLTSLDLNNCKLLTNTGVLALEDASFSGTLTSLNLNNSSNISDEGLEGLKAMSRLTTLSLYGLTEVTGQGLSELTALPLTSLNLQLCRSLTDAGLKALRGVATLTSLDVTGCINVTDAGVEHLSRLTALESLKLDACTSLSGLSIFQLSRLPLLRHLGASMLHRVGGESLSGTPRSVTDLNLRWCKGVSHLNRLPEAVTDNLRVLRLERTRVRGRSVASLLPFCYALETLTLAGCTEVRLTASSIAAGALSRLPYLTELDLSDNFQLHDGAIQTIAAGTVPLVRLNVLRCQSLTDEALGALGIIRSLKSVCVLGCNKMTTSGKERLGRLRPDLEVTQSQILM